MTARIHAATGAAASALGIADTVGTIAPGRAADLVAVAGDPSIRIADLHAVQRVIRDGESVGERLDGAVRLIG